MLRIANKRLALCLLLVLVLVGAGGICTAYGDTAPAQSWGGQNGSFNGGDHGPGGQAPHPGSMMPPGDGGNLHGGPGQGQQPGSGGFQMPGTPYDDTGAQHAPQLIVYAAVFFVLCPVVYWLWSRRRLKIRPGTEVL